MMLYAISSAGVGHGWWIKTCGSKWMTSPSRAEGIRALALNLARTLQLVVASYGRHGRSFPEWTFAHKRCPKWPKAGDVQCKQLGMDNFGRGFLWSSDVESLGFPPGLKRVVSTKRVNMLDFHRPSGSPVHINFCIFLFLRVRGEKRSFGFFQVSGGTCPLLSGVYQIGANYKDVTGSHPKELPIILLGDLF